MKKSKKIIIILAFVVVTAVLLWMAQRLVMPKYQKGIIEGSMIEEYYGDKAPHEVVFIGDCEVYENISTVELYEKYGISSYIRGSAQQLTWQSYYLLEDTLRYEKPKVVVFNVLALKYNEPQSESYNRMSIDGMKWSSSKWNNIKASMTEDENMLEYIFPLLRYHSRWSSLTSDDFKYMFKKDLVTVNGYYMRCDVFAEMDFPPAPTLTDYTLGDNAMYYLEKMADLCEENGVKFVLIKAPTLYPYWYPEWDQQVQDFANSRGIDYINYIDIRDDIGLDMSQDTYDGGLHLNIYGAEKFADSLGEYLVANADLTDYRNDSEVNAMWEEKIQRYNDLREAQLLELEQYGELRSWGMNAVDN
ncbi:MAG: SGNH/GDSL hydrolase family protein [Saccharofermentans sp.]|nr:SGNH/GDSL hydrolase family protein [Saccharofermentans sp.]